MKARKRSSSKEIRSGKLAAIGVNSAAVKPHSASPTRFSFKCVGVREACGLFRKPKPVTRQALIAQIRKRGVIGYRTAGGRYLIPVWQFRPGGGVVEGLPEVLRVIRTSIPGNDPLTPFTFLLQANPVTDGRSPLAVLREGEIEKVLLAVKARIL